jgi:hypothetical protein
MVEIQVQYEAVVEILFRLRILLLCTRRLDNSIVGYSPFESICFITRFLGEKIEIYE